MKPANNFSKKFGGRRTTCLGAAAQVLQSSPWRLNNDPKVQELARLEVAPALFEVPSAPHSLETS